MYHGTGSIWHTYNGVNDDPVAVVGIYRDIIDIHLAFIVYKEMRILKLSQS